MARGTPVNKDNTVLWYGGRDAPFRKQYHLYMNFLHMHSAYEVLLPISMRLSSDKDLVFSNKG